MEDDRLLRQPAVHRPDRGASGRAGAAGRGVPRAAGLRRRLRRQAAPELHQVPALYEAQVRQRRYVLLLDLHCNSSLVDF